MSIIIYRFTIIYRALQKFSLTILLCPADGNDHRI